MDVSVLMLIIFISLSMLRSPISFSMLIAATVAIWVKGDIPFTAIHTNLTSGILKFDYLAIPFFIMAAFVMNRGGTTRQIFSFSDLLVGWIRGGLAHTNILASMIFAGISGSSSADAAGLGAVEVEMMSKAGYNRAFSAAISAVSSVVGPIIPPSIMLVIYGVTAEVSIGRLFLGGLVPGILIGLILMISVYIQSYIWKSKFPPTRSKPKPKELLSGFLNVLPALGAPLIIIGGIILGIMTPTESGAVAVVYAITISIFYKQMSFKNFYEACKDAIFASSLIMFLIATAHTITFVLIIEQSAIRMMEALSFLFVNKIVSLITLNILILIVGCFLEGMPAMLILISLILPIWTHLGLDPVHFGVVLVYNLLIGTLTPPMSVTLFIMSAVNKIPFEDILKETVIFYIPLIISLMLITFFPQIVLFLPNMVFGVN